MKGVIARRFRIEAFDDEPQDLLRPFLDEIYDDAGVYPRTASS